VAALARITRGDQGRHRGDGQGRAFLRHSDRSLMPDKCLLNRQTAPALLFASLFSVSVPPGSWPRWPRRSHRQAAVFAPGRATGMGRGKRSNDQTGPRGTAPGPCSLPVLRRRAPPAARAITGNRQQRSWILARSARGLGCGLEASTARGKTTPQLPGKGKAPVAGRDRTHFPPHPLRRLVCVGVGSNPDLQRTSAPQIPRGFLDRGRAE
jgi:hypothetical protein